MAIVASTRLKHIFCRGRKSLQLSKSLLFPLQIVTNNVEIGDKFVLVLLKKITFYNSAILHESFRNSLINSVSLIF